MTIEEAIKVIKKANVYSDEAIEELKSIEDKAIALDKYGEYYSVLQNCLREREACAVAIKVLEKQISKKPKEVEKKYWNDYVRPNCEKLLGNSIEVYQEKRCHYCGQALNWSEVEE